jgi:hypothetical protein
MLSADMEEPFSSSSGVPPIQVAADLVVDARAVSPGIAGARRSSRAIDHRTVCIRTSASGSR